MKLQHLTVIGALLASFTAQAGDLGLISQSKREELLRKAQVLSPTQVEAKNLLAGPDDEMRPLLQGTVTCDYVPYKNKDEMGNGKSPKFQCRLSNGKVVKVKYGRKNGEVFGEVLGTRLLWALGFPTDKVYPVSIKCRNCHKNPWDVAKAAPSDTHVDRKLYPEVLFEYAAIERKFEGETLESKKDEGVHWRDDLVKVSPKAGGATQAELDALIMAAVFIQHSDSKEGNQRLACPSESLTVSGSQVSCGKPMIMIHDLGSTFGGGTGGAIIKKVQKVDFKGWKKTAIWHEKNSEQPVGYCKAQLDKHVTEGTMSDPLVSEAGRKLFASLIKRLSKQQITDLFTVARVTGHDDDHSVADWVEVFQDRVQQLSRMNCDTKQNTN